MALGRISGEMLEQNLNLTSNLSFNGDTLTISTDGKIGIKNTTPGVELDVTGTARANTVTVLGDLSMEWTMTMDAQDNLNFAYNNNTLISFDSFGNIIGGGSLGDNQKEFVATGAISAGELVSLRNDGTVEVTSIITNTQTENLGTRVVFETGATSTTYISATFDSNSNRIVIAYRDGANSNYGTAIVGTVTGTTITFGTPEVFEFDNADYISATFDSNSNRIVISYRDTGNLNHGTAVVGTVNPVDDSITFGTPEVFETATTTYTSATFDSNTNRIVIAYRDEGNSLRGTAVVGTVNPVDDSITFGTPKVFETGQTLWISATFDWFHDRIVISYRDNSNNGHGTAVVGTVNPVDDSITFGTPEVFEYASTSHTSITFDSYINKVVVAYTDSGNFSYGTSALGTVNPADNSITFETPVVYETSTAIYNSAAFDFNSNKVVIAYRDEGNGSRGTGFVYTPANVATTNADSWIGIAAEDIADTATGKVDLTGAINRSQTGLTKDAIYYIDESGNLTTTATDYMLGRAISTTDIQIFGKAISEFSTAIDVDFTTNTPTTTSGLVLTSDGDSSYSFQAPVVTTQIADLTDIDFVTNTPTTTSGLVLTSDGDSSYSFQAPVTLGDNQKEFVATGAISAGEVVSLRNDGTVEVTQISTAENSYTSSLTTPYDTPRAFESAYDSVNNRLFIATIDGASQEILIKIGSISNSVITFGSTISTGLYVSLSVGLPRYKIAYDETTDQLVIAYNAVDTPFYTLRCQVGTVSGNSITWSNAPYYQSSYPFHITDLLVLPGKSQAVINWIEWNSGNHSIKTVVANLGNNSVTLGNVAVINTYQNYDINYCKSVYIPTVTWSTWGADASVAIFNSDTVANPGNSSKQYILYSLYSINAIGDISYQAGGAVDTNGGIPGENKLAVHYDSLSQRLFAVLANYTDGSSSDTRIFHSDIPFTETASGMNFYTGVTLTNIADRSDPVLFTDTTDNLLKFAYSDSATGIQYFSTLTIGSGTSVTVSDETALTQTSTSLGLDVNIINNNYVFTHDGLGAGSNEVGSTVYKKSYNLTSNADSWIGIAAEDIADTATGKIDLPGAINRSQTGLVKDTIYYVSANGTLASTKTEYGMLGKAISDTDLQLFGNTPNDAINYALDISYDNAVEYTNSTDTHVKIFTGIEINDIDDSITTTIPIKRILRFSYYDFYFSLDVANQYIYHHQTTVHLFSASVPISRKDLGSIFIGADAGTVVDIMVNNLNTKSILFLFADGRIRLGSFSTQFLGHFDYFSLGTTVYTLAATDCIGFAEIDSGAVFNIFVLSGTGNTLILRKYQSATQYDVNGLSTDPDIITLDWSGKDTPNTFDLVTERTIAISCTTGKIYIFEFDLALYDGTFGSRTVVNTQTIDLGYNITGFGISNLHHPNQQWFHQDISATVSVNHTRAFWAGYIIKEPVNVNDPYEISAKYVSNAYQFGHFYNNKMFYGGQYTLISQTVGSAGIGSGVKGIYSNEETYSSSNDYKVVNYVPKELSYLNEQISTNYNTLETEWDTTTTHNKHNLTITHNKYTITNSDPQIGSITANDENIGLASYPTSVFNIPKIIEYCTPAIINGLASNTTVLTQLPKGAKIIDFKWSVVNVWSREFLGENFPSSSGNKIVLVEDPLYAGTSTQYLFSNTANLEGGTGQDQFAGYRLVDANQYRWFDYYYGKNVAPYICWVYGASLSQQYSIKGYVLYI